MKFLVDECGGKPLAVWLSKHGYDTVYIGDVSPGISDSLVLQKAVQENRILITNDKDFGEMVFKHRMKHVGILLLRLFDEKASAKIRLIEIVLKSHSHDLPMNFVVATDKLIRIINT